MKKLSLFVISIIVVLAGCAMPGQTKTESTAFSALIGCAAGAVTSKIVMDGKPGVGCLVGGAAGGLIGYLKAREAELAAMRDTASALPGATVETQSVTVADKATGEKKQIEAFRSLSVPLPPSSLSDEEGKRVYSNLAQLAQKHGSIVTIAGGTAIQREKAAELVRRGGYTQPNVSPTVKTGAGRNGDLVVILAPSDKSHSVVV